jgi:predicted nucleic acid-binding protein
LKALILDASIAAVWVLPDEKHALADMVFELLPSITAYVPNLWQFEIRNILITALRRGRISSEQVQTFLSLLSQLPVEQQTSDFNAAFILAQKFSLSFYDASYLELATRLHLPLATLDKKLAAAAEACNALFLQQDML